MHNAFTYRVAMQADIPAMQHLVVTGFKAFLAPHCSPAGARTFYRYVDALAFAKRLHHQHMLVLCHCGDNLVGLIEMRDFHHVSLLFVAAAYQRRGIARTLLQKAVMLSRHQQPAYPEMIVNAVPSAVALYKKLGFRPTKPFQEVYGLRLLPMRLTL